MAKILFVDDSEAIAGIYALSLEEAGHQVIRSFGGRDALVQYEYAISIEKRFDLIILDLAMPCLNGFQVAELIRARGDNYTKIAFLSAYDDYEVTPGRAAGLGAVAVWTKPMMFGELKAAVDDVLSQPLVSE